jgi:hypothetical protein
MVALLSLGERGEFIRVLHVVVSVPQSGAKKWDEEFIDMCAELPARSGQFEIVQEDMLDFYLMDRKGAAPFLREDHCRCCVDVGPFPSRAIHAATIPTFSPHSLSSWQTRDGKTDVLHLGQSLLLRVCQWFHFLDSRYDQVSIGGGYGLEPLSISW